SLPATIEIKMMLSMPSTISRKHSVSRLIQTAGSAKSGMMNSIGLFLQFKYVAFNRNQKNHRGNLSFFGDAGVYGSHHTSHGHLSGHPFHDRYPYGHRIPAVCQVHLYPARRPGRKDNNRSLYYSCASSGA